MLKSIDALLGFALVMLVASMAVTVLTQIWTTLVNTRGLHLREGLAGLLRQIDPRISPVDANTVVEHILAHPLIAEGGRLGHLVHREEFTRLILEMASGEGLAELPGTARQALQAALLANGIADPAATLGRIRDAGLSLELSNPRLAASARHDLAILQAASSDFVAKINGWFDPAIDRVSARFTSTARRIALINALVVAAATQLDALALLDRLSANDALRSALVEQAVARATVPAATLPEIERLANAGLVSAPSNPVEWRRRWTWAKAPGVALSVLLLSLGAPFWFEALKNLLRIRSAIALEDDGQRARRQSPPHHRIA